MVTVLMRLTLVGVVVAAADAGVAHLPHFVGRCSSGGSRSLSRGGVFQSVHHPTLYIFVLDHRAVPESPRGSCRA